MSDAIIVALITGVLAVVGEIIVSAKNTRELYAKLAKMQSSGSPLMPPAGFSGLGDMEQPAVWRRNLEGLSRTINFGKK